MIVFSHVREIIFRASSVVEILEDGTFLSLDPIKVSQYNLTLVIKKDKNFVDCLQVPKSFALHKSCFVETLRNWNVGTLAINRKFLHKNLSVYNISSGCVYLPPHAIFGRLRLEERGGGKISVSIEETTNKSRKIENISSARTLTARVVGKGKIDKFYIKRLGQLTVDGSGSIHVQCHPITVVHKLFRGGGNVFVDIIDPKISWGLK